MREPIVILSEAEIEKMRKAGRLAGIAPSPGRYGETRDQHSGTQ